MNVSARLAGLILFVVALLIPVLDAQEKKDPPKDADKKEVKKDAKADPKKDAKADAKKDAKADAKKDAKADPKKDAKADPKKDAKADPKKDAKADPKKAAKDDDDDKKKPDPKAKVEEEKLVYGSWTSARLGAINATSNRLLTIHPVDPYKVQKLNVWKLEQLASITQAPNPGERLNRMAAYQRDLPSRSNDIYTAKEVEVRAGDNMKIRTMFLPAKYDDAGNLVRWTKKEIKELVGNSKLKGYPAEMDALRAGQIVEVYFAKVTPPAGSTKGKKKLSIDDEVDAAMTRPEVVLIVVTMEAPMRQ